MKSVETVKISEQRGYFQKELIEVVGDHVESLKITDFKAPESEKKFIITKLSKFMNGRLMKIIEPKPAINKSKCVGCRECVRSCPQHTIVFDPKKKRPVILYEKCIKCYCCQELCPADAVKIKQNPIVKMIH